MSQESQKDFFKDLEMDEKDANEGEKNIAEESGVEKKSKLPLKPNDGLDFNCESCGDSGCPQCGFREGNK